jgi:putative sterol carrier protein
MNTTAVFPHVEWMQATKDKLNSDEQYAQVARNWEGDLRLILEPDGNLNEAVWLYWDFWHGKCREAYVEDQTSSKTPAFVLTAPYGNFVKVLSGEVGPMQALMGRMLKVKGSFPYFMRNVPTILNFVRCCQEITKEWQ